MIHVPAHVAVALARKNLVNAILQLISDAGDGGLSQHDLCAAFHRLEVPAREAGYVENRLVREKIVRTDGQRYWMGHVSDLQAYLKRGGPVTPCIKLSDKAAGA